VPLNHFSDSGGGGGGETIEVFAREVVSADKAAAAKRKAGLSLRTFPSRRVNPFVPETT